MRSLQAVGGAQAALSILADESLSRDWTNAATLLGKICMDEDNREPITRMRASGRPAAAVLISAVLASVSKSNCKTPAAQCLVFMSAHPDCSSLCVSAVQQMNFWDPIALLLQDRSHDPDVKAHMYAVQCLKSPCYCMVPILLSNTICVNC